VSSIYRREENGATDGETTLGNQLRTSAEQGATSENTTAANSPMCLPIKGNYGSFRLMDVSFCLGRHRDVRCKQTPGHLGRHTVALASVRSAHEKSHSMQTKTCSPVAPSSPLAVSQEVSYMDTPSEIHQPVDEASKHLSLRPANAVYGHGGRLKSRRACRWRCNLNFEKKQREKMLP